jgi:hypothetical protein
MYQAFAVSILYGGRKKNHRTIGPPGLRSARTARREDAVEARVRVVREIRSLTPGAFTTILKNLPILFRLELIPNSAIFRVPIF